MLTFLFWNINKKPIETLIDGAAQENDVDILILAECDIHLPQLLTAINENQKRMFDYCFSPTDKIIYLTRFSSKLIELVSDGENTSIRRLVPPIGDDLIIAGVHSRSKLFQKTEDQVFDATVISDNIEAAEKKYSHRRTIAVGDFNMNPFEYGMIGTRGLHATMDREIAKKRVRTVNGKPYRFMYNPMWSLMGDLSEGPPGSFCYNKASHINYCWHMFDQVLVGSDLIERFIPESLKIITEIHQNSLITKKGIPNKNTASDHLPILFQLEL